MTSRTWWVVARVLLGLSLVFAVLQVWQIIRSPAAYDFGLFSEAGRRVFTGGLYDETADYAYRWSPVLAYVLGPLTAFGPWPWRILQLVLAATMPTRRLSLIVLLSYPLWFDVWLGNVNILVLWLAAWGLSGRRWAVAGFLGLALLIPRPLVVPLVAWFLWREPWTRLPFAAMFGAHALIVAGSGWGPAWVERLLSSTSEVGSVFNYGPSRIIGLAWLPFGIALGAVAWWRGRPALAGLLVSPYWLPYYLMLPLADLARPRSAPDAASPSRQPRHPPGVDRVPGRDAQRGDQPGSTPSRTCRSRAWASWRGGYGHAAMWVRSRVAWTRCCDALVARRLASCSGLGGGRG